MRQVVQLGDRSTGRGTFGGEFGARHCSQWGLYSVRVRQRRDAALFPVYFGQTCYISALITRFGNNVSVERVTSGELYIASYKIISLGGGPGLSQTLCSVARVPSPTSYPPPVKPYGIHSFFFLRISSRFTSLLLNDSEYKRTTVVTGLIGRRL